MDRETYLQRVRSAMEASQLPPIPEMAPGGLVPDLPEAGVTGRFLKQVEAVDGHTHLVGSDDEAVRLIDALLEQYEATSYLGWDPDHLPISGLAERLRATPLDAVVPGNPEGRLEKQSGYMDLLAGITGASAGLAESGSIVLESGPGRPRMASLIPLAHIALLRKESITQSLSHWIADHPEAAYDTSNLFMITGPSRTADIEQTLNLGVHGPRHLHVIVLDR
ncbi:MAG: LUD domain-containing protein [Acidimicrobiia bacterium]|nr:LUD domain-containing protein [Acidimicrobiia bacterium]